MESDQNKAFGPDFDYPESFCPVPAYPVPLASGEAYSSRLFPEYVYDVDEDSDPHLENA